MWPAIRKENDPRWVFDRHVALTCPHCGVPTSTSAISIPRYEFLERFQPPRVGIVYRCDNCAEPIMLVWAATYDFGNHRVGLSDEYEQAQRALESFDYEYLPGEVAADFREALLCYSNVCHNAFAAMSRRCVQSVAVDLGAKGSDKVSAQLKDLKAMAEIDEETFGLLKQIIIDGHDGAHPHLPTLNADRAAVLLELMKDVLYQLYVRKGKLQRAMAMRPAAIDQGKR